MRAVERLAGYLVDGGEGEGELAGWLAASARFRAFAEAHRDKIRKKLRGTADPAARADVLAELEVAFRLLADRRIELAFEAYGTGRRGPDFTVVFRAVHRFNLEVTRPRSSEALASAVLAKLRQLPADLPNAVLVVLDGPAPGADELNNGLRTLKARADGREYQRLSAVFAFGRGGGAEAWANPEGRRALPEGAATACLRCLATG